MCKYLLFSDLHLGIHGNSDVWFEASLALAKDMLDICEAYEIDDIICLGDLFHDRKNLSSKVIYNIRKFLKILKNKNLHIIAGNHDIYYKNSNEIVNIDILKKFENVTIINSSTKYRDFDVIPWAGELIKSNKVALGHFEINGIFPGASSKSLTLSDLKHYDLVLSGHFHTPIEKSNFRYIGSCMPFTFADVDSPRGFYVFTSGINRLEFYEFNQCPKYVVQMASKPIDKEKITGNVVKLIFTKEVSTIEEESIINDIMLLKPLFLYPEFQIEKEKNEIRLDEGNVEVKSNFDIAMDYIEKSNVPGHINKSMLKQVFQSLV